MPNQISQQLLAEFYGQESSDPLLMLVTLSDPSFGEIRLVNNIDDIESRGQTYTGFPMEIRPPSDDGESSREVAIEFDNVSLELIGELRSITSPIEVKIETVLASDPDTVQMEYSELKMRNLTYNKQRISARLFLDNFLYTEMTSESYTPSEWPGLF